MNTSTNKNSFLGRRELERPQNVSAFVSRRAVFGKKFFQLFFAVRQQSVESGDGQKVDASFFERKTNVFAMKVDRVGRHFAQRFKALVYQATVLLLESRDERLKIFVRVGVSESDVGGSVGFAEDAEGHDEVVAAVV
jgi:hypothetical protein